MVQHCKHAERQVGERQEEKKKERDVKGQKLQAAQLTFYQGQAEKGRGGQQRCP